MTGISIIQIINNISFTYYPVKLQKFSKHFSRLVNLHKKRPSKAVPPYKSWLWILHYVTTILWYWHSSLLFNLHMEVLFMFFVCLFLLIWVFSVSPTDHNIQEMIAYAYTLRQMHAYVLLKPYSLSAFMYVHIYLTWNIHMYKTGMKTHTNIVLWA